MGRYAGPQANILRRCFELMTERAEALAWLISLENGKALRDARGEVAYAAEFFRWNAEEAVRIHGEFMTAPSGANRIIVEYQPIGTCVLITPWNFPAAMATRKIGPALAAGCTVILKPAMETPLTAYALAALYEEAGVPAGVVNVLTTTEPGPVVSHMLADPRVRKLSFTGSTPVGKLLLAEAAKSVVSSSMELGGNAPVLVFEDADIDVAIEGTMVAKMRNAGQACTAANRIYVHSKIYGAFTERLVQRMSSLRVGPGTMEETEMRSHDYECGCYKDQTIGGRCHQSGCATSMWRNQTNQQRLLLSSNSACRRADRCIHQQTGNLRTGCSALAF
jgi:succinate-semialdehyde dehydrogenase/glutarate-semialdehyde dehydrogenase